MVSEKAKKPKVQQLSSLTPINLAQEKSKFFEKEFKYNPKFEYKSIIDLSKNPEVDTQYLKLAFKILNTHCKAYIQEYYQNQDYLLEDEFQEYFDQYVARHGLEEQLELEFTTGIAVPAFISHSKKTEQKSKIFVRVPLKYTHTTVLGALNHEIGTHFLRKENNKRQPWYKNKKYKLMGYIATEEGLASINQLFDVANKPPLLYKSACNYVAAFFSSKMGFSDLFQLLRRYMGDPDRTWQLCIRVKRGIADTSQSRGFYKDQVYFKGAIQVIKQRHYIDFIKLHAVKLSLEDYFEFKGEINITNIKLPHFLQDIQKYYKLLNEIAKVNFIDDY